MTSPTIIEDELKALPDTISKVETLAKPESVQEADKYLRRTDCKNAVHPDAALRRGTGNRHGNDQKAQARGRLGEKRC